AGRPCLDTGSEKARASATSTPFTMAVKIDFTILLISTNQRRSKEKKPQRHKGHKGFYCFKSFVSFVSLWFLFYQSVPSPAPLLPVRSVSARLVKRIVTSF